MEHTEVARMGGKARAAKMTKRARKQAARNAVNARWEKYRANGGSKNGQVKTGK